MLRMRRIALICCFFTICIVIIVRFPSKNLLSGILEVDPQDAERIMMERYAHSLQFKGNVRIKSLASAFEDDHGDDVEVLPKRLTKKERSTTIYFPPSCRNGRHWQICKKIVPGFMIAGAEHSAANVLYETFKTHPQVWDLVKSNNMYERTGNISLLNIPDAQDAPFFGSRSYNDIEPSTKNLEWYLRYFPSIKDIPVMPHNPVFSGESLPHIQHYGLGHVNMEHQEAPSFNEQKILVGECAPSYLHLNGASKRIANTMPEMKAVFIFRDPIDRAYLNFLEQKQYAAGYSFEEIVAEELLILKECIARPGSKKWTEFLRCHSEEAKQTAKRMGLPNRPRLSNARDLVVKGLYYSQLHEFVKYVPFTKILVLRTEDLYDRKSTVSTMVRLCHFLNLDPAPFVNYPIEIGTDPMAPLRYGHGSIRAFGSDGIMIQDEDDIADSNENMELEYEQQPHKTNSPNSGTITSGHGPQTTFTDPPLDLATRFRLQRVFEPFNQKLVDMFERRQDFPGWEYDVDRG
ncbi:hypothetical protein BGW38_010876 [Lunasporangiospora selenospora]|uniref:Sulfotransferase domain-containing protein n=1 Tax=Lunasporangiospora selenospora TaxID=979761 RepID=A0A9P6FWJ1_9FUNG|nr:hypothetical protein BGW38_010876 [Lunasporangiospora selenospora]